MRRVVLVVVLALGLSFLAVLSARALTVSPVKLEVRGDPGQTLAGEIELYNEQATVRTYYSSFENFEAKGEGGEPSFVPGDSGLAAWITTEERVVLQPGERRDVPFTITIPADADPGGHFAAIFWGTSPPDPGAGEVVIGARIGVLVLLTVTGEIKEGGGILEFGAERRFFTSLPITLFYRLANDGGDRIVPRGEIVIRNTVGMKTATVDPNPGLGSVLPGSVRRFEVKWGKAQEGAGVDEAPPAADRQGFFGAVRHQWRNFAFGMYTAQLNLSWGEGVTAASSYRFFVIPWQLLSVVLAVLVPAGLLGWFGLRRYSRKQSSWAIRKKRRK